MYLILHNIFLLQLGLHVYIRVFISKADKAVKLSFNNCPYVITWLCSPQACNNNNNNNYIPVSLTSVIVKMLEATIKDELMHYFKRENLLSTCQHGFRSSHSCVTQILQAVNK